MAVDLRLDPADGMPAIEAGDWAAEKHRLLRQYLDISHATRRKWVTGVGGATYIELFSGPGRLFLKESAEFIDGSPVVAAREALRTKTLFNEMHLGDIHDGFCISLNARLASIINVRATVYPYGAAESARRIIGKLNPHGLHFAFLDPFGFEGLPFSIIEGFSRFKRMDLLIYVSAMGLQRNLPMYAMSEAACPLDEFAPGWRNVVKGLDPGDAHARGRVIEHWLELIRSVGFQDARAMPMIRGSSNQPLYWLALVSKSGLATRLWNEINREKQRPLF